MYQREEIFELLRTTKQTALNSCVFNKLKKDKNLVDEIEEFTKFLNTSNFSLKLYHWLHQLNEIPKCATCNKNLTLVSIVRGYKDTCSKKCWGKYESTLEFIEAKKQRCFEKHGVYHHMQLKETLDKIKTTNLEKYGVECVFQAEEIKDKIKQTNIENLGVDNPWKSKVIIEQIKQTNLDRYGVEHPLQSLEIQEKAKQTCLDRYGVDNPAKSEVVKQHYRETCLEKYGEDHYLKSDIGKEIYKSKLLEKFGVENVWQRDDVKEKLKETWLENYGVDNPWKAEVVKDLIRQRNLEHHGVEYPMQSLEIMEKAKATCLERYGVERPAQSPEIREKYLSNSYSSLYSVKEYLLPSGKIAYTQGYGPKFLDWYFGNGFLEDNLLIESKVKTFIYNMNGKNHVYFPDFEIYSKNEIIEIKSTYTLFKDFETNICKFDAVVNEGYNLKIFVFDNDEPIVIDYKNKNSINI